MMCNDGCGRPAYRIVGTRIFCRECCPPWADTLVTADIPTIAEAVRAAVQKPGPKKEKRERVNLVKELAKAARVARLEKVAEAARVLEVSLTVDRGHCNATQLESLREALAALDKETP